MKRSDGREPHELRPVKIQTGFQRNAEGSALITVGGTTVLCAASVEDKVPQFLRNTGRGWVTAEYAMLPRATNTRMQRESSAGKVGGRTHEIQRLIGRSLRAVTDLAAFGERTLWVDCDVLEADGGTRTASITGAFVAVALAFEKLRAAGKIARVPLVDHVAAVSVGVIDDEVRLDLCYEEDSRAEVDMNVVMTGSGRLVEIQGTAEGAPFSWHRLDEMGSAGRAGIRELVALQAEVLGPLAVGKK
ncbi:MAG TPA: ribonuclease PH [bacterium]